MLSNVWCSTLKFLTREHSATKCSPLQPGNSHCNPSVPPVCLYLLLITGTEEIMGPKRQAQYQNHINKPGILQHLRNLLQLALKLNLRFDILDNIMRYSLTNEILCKSCMHSISLKINSARDEKQLSIYTAFSSSPAHTTPRFQPNSAVQNRTATSLDRQVFLVCFY